MTTCSRGMPRSCRYLALSAKPRLHAGAVGRDIDQRPVAEPAQHRVLRDQHVLVFLEGALDLGKQLFGRGGIVLAIAVGSGPHEPAGMFGLRRDAVEYPQAKAAVARIVLVSTLADVAGACELQDAGWRDILELAPAIDPAAEFDGFCINARRNAVEHPADEFHAVPRGTHLHLGALVGIDIARQRRFVDISAVGLIEEIVRQQQIVAVDPLGLALVRPALMPGIADDRWRDRPAPDRPSISRPDRPARRPERSGPARCSGSSAGREFRRICQNRRKPCRDIRSGCFAEHFAAGQRHAAMATAVFQRHGRAVGGAIEHHRFFEQRSPHRLFD